MCVSGQPPLPAHLPQGPRRPDPWSTLRRREAQRRRRRAAPRGHGPGRAGPRGGGRGGRRQTRFPLAGSRHGREGRGSFAQLGGAAAGRGGDWPGVRRRGGPKAQAEAEAEAGVYCGSEEGAGRPALGLGGGAEEREAARGVGRVARGVEGLPAGPAEQRRPPMREGLEAGAAVVAAQAAFPCGAACFRAPARGTGAGRGPGGLGPGTGALGPGTAGTGAGAQRWRRAQTPGAAPGGTGAPVPGTGLGQGFRASAGSSARGCCR